MAWSAESRKTRGLGFPSWGFGVIVPTSTNPNPNLYKPSTASPCLSKPAAMPTGFLNFNPNTFTSCRKRTFFTVCLNFMTLMEFNKVISPEEKWQAYQRCRVHVTVQWNQTQTNHFHCPHMCSLRPHKPLQQGHQLVGIETLISDHSEVGSK